MIVKIIGMGNVGKALYKTIAQTTGFLDDKIKVKIWDVKYGEPRTYGEKVDFLHICFPYSDKFINEVKQYLAAEPKVMIIHSTVKPGTTRQLSDCGCPAAYSPVMGPHDKLNLTVPLFAKAVAAPEKEVLKRAVDHLGRLTFRTAIFNPVEGLELGKLLSTLYFGWCIAFQKEVRKICMDKKVYEEAYEQFNWLYNQNYEILEMIEADDYFPIRPVLKDIPGEIGGTCVIPNAALLENFCPNELSNFLLRMNEKWKGENNGERNLNALKRN